MYRLKKDIVSIVNGRIYGQAGDEVKIIKDERIAIVELNSGDRFTCFRDDITLQKVEIKKEPISIEKPISRSGAAPKKIAAVVSPNQTQLF